MTKLLTEEQADLIAGSQFEIRLLVPKSVVPFLGESRIQQIIKFELEGLSGGVRPEARGVEIRFNPLNAVFAQTWFDRLRMRIHSAVRRVRMGLGIGTSRWRKVNAAQKDSK